MAVTFNMVCVLLRWMKTWKENLQRGHQMETRDWRLVSWLCWSKKCVYIDANYTHILAIHCNLGNSICLLKVCCCAPYVCLNIHIALLSDARQVELVELKELQKEYVLVNARLKLLSNNPDPTHMIGASIFSVNFFTAFVRYPLKLVNEILCVFFNN
jgi:hypothetical protein